MSLGAAQRLPVSRRESMISDCALLLCGDCARANELESLKGHDGRSE